MKRAITILMTICMLLTSVTFGQLSASAKVSVPKTKVKNISIVDTTTLKIKWKKVNSVSGYELYCKKPGSSFKKLATLSKNNTSYTHKKLTTNKKYFYKIRTYKYVNGRKYYSSFSNQMGKKPTNYLLQLTKPYDIVNYTEYTNGKTMNMGGDPYTNGFSFGWYISYATFNLKGKYSEISFVCGNVDGYNTDAKIHIFSDDECVETISVVGGNLPESYTVDIEYASKLKFQLEGDWGDHEIGIANIKVYK